MIYGRIDLEKTNYSLYRSAKIISAPDKEKLRSIYYKYCSYKKFKSVESLFDFDIDNSLIIGYYDLYELEAFTLIQILDYQNAKAIQFCWDYEHPNKQLGWTANFHECAFLKMLGYKYYYLGEHNDYKSKLDGYEILGDVSSLRSMLWHLR